MLSGIRGKDENFEIRDCKVNKSRITTRINDLERKGYIRCQLIKS